VARDAAGGVGGVKEGPVLSKEGLGAILPLAGHWSTQGYASWRRAPLASGHPPPFCIGDAPMAEQLTATCPQCSRAISPDDTIVFGYGRLGHLDCRRPHLLSAEERTLLLIFCRDHQVAECVRCAGRFNLREVASLDSFGIRTHGCPWCHTDLTDSIRAHLYSCAMLPVEVRRRARAAREAVRSLVKQSHQLRDAADVAVREVETALHALREMIRQSARSKNLETVCLPDIFGPRGSKGK
jgi:hypothetical protein